MASYAQMPCTLYNAHVHSRIPMRTLEAISIRNDFRRRRGQLLGHNRMCNSSNRAILLPCRQSLPNGGGDAGTTGCRCLLTCNLYRSSPSNRTAMHTQVAVSTCIHQHHRKDKTAGMYCSSMYLDRTYFPRQPSRSQDDIDLRLERNTLELPMVPVLLLAASRSKEESWGCLYRPWQTKRFAHVLHTSQHNSRLSLINTSISQIC
mmetsp:Transcript_88149/g.139334  ORF Transcript_88149/g.139334 Transcript_88149/m.139334 type:complete len:205 (+) Transcript_88149:649-1263(+)